MQTQSTMPTVYEQVPHAGLKDRIRGGVILPTDDLYDQSRMAWNLSVDQRPTLIVMAENVVDIVEAVRYASEQNLGIAVQSTGHGVVRAADDCLLIITSRMKEISINVEEQTAYVQAGAKWGMVLEVSQEVGLTPLLGSSPDVGAIGYTLGGGMGWLARKYGLATDSVRLFDLVTADGQLLRASSSENNDLFWGLRGGGGSLGIITGIEIQLYPVKSVYGGNLIYSIEIADEVFKRYCEWIKSVPDELTSSIVIMNFPPINDFPELLRGKSVVIIRGCFCGPADEGEALLQEWRNWHTPMVDDFKHMPFSQIATISNDPVDPLPGMSSGAWLRELSDEAIDVLIRYGSKNELDSPLTVTEIRHAGGAIARVDPQTNAYSHREEKHILQLIGMTPSLEARQHLQDFIQQFKTALSSHLTGNVYMNFLEGEESRARVKDAYSMDSYQRLTSLKTKYDPENRLSYSFNVLPKEPIWE